MRAIVLAGGFGARLRQMVPELPKPMAPVAGRPFLEYVLDGLIESGIRDVVLSVGYRGDVIQAHFGSDYRGAVVHYALESKPLGTGGAIAYALRGREGAPAVVLNGDTLLQLDYTAVFEWYRRDPSTVAMVLKDVPDVARYGAVIEDGGRVSGFAEKGRSGRGLINAGVYIVRPEVFEMLGLAGNFSFEKDVLQDHLESIRPRAYVTKGYFIDIGIPDDYERAQRELPALFRGNTPRGVGPT
ncbi:MAG: nucleotidyltransferase family protein [Gammaproteobacteria bacterium]|nr:nucleotidyltransferase family protein [Gammaproteobacteria bacterium]